MIRKVTALASQRKQLFLSKCKLRLMEIYTYMGDHESPEEVDVLIIGAGFTGLSAARELQRLGGVNFVVVDSYDDHLGGRAYSYDYHYKGKTYTFDHGAEYVGDLQTELMGFIRKNMPDELVNGAVMRFPYPDQVMYLNKERYVFPSKDALFGITGVPDSLGLWSSFSLIGILFELLETEMRIDVVQPWRTQDELKRLDEVTIESYLNKPWVTPACADLLRISIQALLSVEATETSPFYLLWYTACNDGLINEVNDNKGGPQQYWLKCGTSGVAKRFAEEVQQNIHEGVSVKQLSVDGDIVNVQTSAGKQYRAKRVLVATSPHSAARIRYEPELPVPRKTWLDQPMGKTRKCQVFYRTRWWRKAAHCKHYNGYVGGASYPVMWIMDNTPTDQPDAADEEGFFCLMTFTVGDLVSPNGKEQSKQAIIKEVTKAIAYLLQDDRALNTSDQFIDLVHNTWDPKETHVGGGPNTILNLGVLTSEAGECVNKSSDNDRIFFASSETSKKLNPTSEYPFYDFKKKKNLPEYTDSGSLMPNKTGQEYQTQYSDKRQSLGYMDGAIISGRYVANEIAKSIGLSNYNKAIDREDKRAQASKFLIQEHLKDWNAKTVEVVTKLVVWALEIADKATDLSGKGKSHAQKILISAVELALHHVEGGLEKFEQFLEELFKLVVGGDVLDWIHKELGKVELWVAGKFIAALQSFTKGGYHYNSTPLEQIDETDQEAAKNIKILTAKADKLIISISQKVGEGGDEQAQVQDHSCFTLMQSCRPIRIKSE